MDGKMNLSGLTEQMGEVEERTWWSRRKGRKGGFFRLSPHWQPWLREPSVNVQLKVESESYSAFS